MLVELGFWLIDQGIAEVPFRTVYRPNPGMKWKGSQLKEILCGGNPRIH